MKKQTHSTKATHFFQEFELEIDVFVETHVVVVAKSISGKNDLLKISCKLGIPVRGYTYDSQTDCYYLEGIDYLNLGSVPLSYKLATKDGSWQVKIPIPESLLLKNFDSLQKKDLLNFKNNFPEDKFAYYFVQMINPN